MIIPKKRCKVTATSAKSKEKRQKKFITKFLIHFTNFVTHVSKFVIHVTKFVTKTILYERKNYLADNENYLADNENYLADSGARNGLCRAQPNFRASECRGQASL